MRFSLIDLLVGWLALAFGLLPCVWLAPENAELMVVTLPFSTGLYIIGGSWLYRRLQFRPVLLPRCPHCNRRRHFFPADSLGDRYRMICVDCRQAFIYWFSQPPAEYKPGSLPEVVVAEPYILGPCRQIWAGQTLLEQRRPELTGECYKLELYSARTKKPLPFSPMEAARQLQGFGAGFRLVTRGGTVSVFQSNGITEAEIETGTIRVKMNQSDCPLANGIAQLQLLDWLKHLEGRYGPLNFQSEGQIAHLGSFF